jgi:hypothetical protein
MESPKQYILGLGTGLNLIFVFCPFTVLPFLVLSLDPFFFCFGGKWTQ